jgi:tetratricopeptide (TPR) repeat protein
MPVQMERPVVMRSIRNVVVLPVLGVLCVGALARAAAAAGKDNPIVRGTLPERMLDALLPEELPELSYPAYFDDLDKARAQSFAGRYKQSLLTLHKVKDVPPAQLPLVALVRSKSLAALGRHGEALKAVSDPAVAEVPAVQVRKAEILADLGKDDEAVALLRRHLAAHPDSLAGRFALGAVLEKVGDIEGAKGAFTWFVAQPQGFLEQWKQNPNAPVFDSADNLTTIGRALDRWASLTEAYRDQVHLHNTILNLFVKAYDVKDRGHWPAHVAAAEYFMTHDNRQEAEKELKEALAANPQDAQAWRLMGLIALDTFNFNMADRAAGAVRAADPDAVSAELLEARNLLLQRRPQDAERPVRRVLARQPRNVEAMALLAAVYALQLKEDQANEVLAQVEKLDADNATAYFEVAEQLGAMRQYPRAIAKYKVAIERAPWWTAARNGLGLLYTQSGDEIEARAALEEARKLDPFNLSTTNYLRLLDDMDRFAQKETDHFIVMYDAKQDPLIPEYFAEYLETVHAEVCATFHHEPKVKTMIEVFPTHDAFSVRTTGSPWIGTVGASTGRVIALVSPRGGENTMGTYNWAQVLRHEYTHTVTLSATDNRIAHWFTEGLAVLEERGPLRWDWVPMLYNAVKNSELFTLEDLTWAFVRPKKPHHRTLAYAQSFWVCKYIQETYGHDALLKMLEEFKSGGRQEDVFPKITGRSITEFTQEFGAWTQKQVAGWGYDLETTKRYNDLRAKAEGLSKAKQFEESIKAWQEVHTIRPMDPLPHQRLAGLYLGLKKYAEAVEHLDALHQAELKDNRYAKRIARVYRENKELDKAQKYAMQAVYIDPYDPGAHEMLAAIYQQTGDAGGLEREQRVLAVLKEWQAAQKRERDRGLPGAEEN